jgi:hypothetical protein
MPRRILTLFLLAVAIVAGGCTADVQSAPPPRGDTAPASSGDDYLSIEALESAALKKDVPYVPTAEATVEEMLRLAGVSRDDVVYDLGSGDGRIVITAARKYGARGVGIDIDPVRIAEANENAKKAGVTEKVRFIQGDLFNADLRDATAVTLYLLRSVNLRLRPKLLAELRPGTPVVSHDFDMGDWEADEHVQLEGDDVFLWIIPAQVEGTWRWKAGKGERTMAVIQDFQKFTGTVNGTEIRNGHVRGDRISFEIGEERYSGTVAGDTIVGQVEIGKKRSPWRAIK